jgi:hypothetical protein
MYHYANTNEVLVIALFTSITVKPMEVTLERQFPSAEWWLLKVYFLVNAGRYLDNGFSAR